MQKGLVLFPPGQTKTKNDKQGTGWQLRITQSMWSLFTEQVANKRSYLKELVRTKIVKIADSHKTYTV